MAKREPPFEPGMLEALAKALGDTDHGLIGTEIGQILLTCRIPDTDPASTKWKRLFNAFVTEQNRKQWSNHVIGFIHYAMKPVRWSSKREKFERLRDELNKALAFSGLELGDDGKVRRSASVNTLEEAEKRARSLRATLESRGIHQDVLFFCRAELLTDNYFHAVLEAAKSVANKIRRLSGLTSDGAELATQAFALGKNGMPMLSINPLTTDTEKGEQKGFTNLLIGLFGTFRNPTAHAEKIYWPITRQDALDIFSLVSLVHRKLDLVKQIPPSN